MRSLLANDALLAAAAEPDLSHGGGSTPLRIAAARGHRACVRSLVAAGADLVGLDADGLGVAHLLAAHDAADILKELMERGVDVQGFANQHQSPLHVAAQHDQAGVVAFLLEVGADPLLLDSAGYMPIHRAVLSGAASAVERLTRTEAQVLAKDASGRTPIHLAVDGGKRSVLHGLLSRSGAQEALAMRDDRGWTALHRAVAFQEIEMCAQLLDAGCPVDVASGRGMTPLHLAGLLGARPLYELLTSRGADEAAVDACGASPKQHLDGAEWSAPFVPRETDQAHGAAWAALWLTEGPRGSPLRLAFWEDGVVLDAVDGIRYGAVPARLVCGMRAALEEAGLDRQPALHHFPLTNARYVGVRSGESFVEVMSPGSLRIEFVHGKDSVSASPLQFLSWGREWSFAEALLQRAGDLAEGGAFHGPGKPFVWPGWWAERRQ